MHPLTDKLAAAMLEADGNPTTMANGQDATEAFRSWADAALTALTALAERDGHAVLLTELGAIGEGYTQLRDMAQQVVDESNRGYGTDDMHFVTALHFLERHLTAEPLPPREVRA